MAVSFSICFNGLNQMLFTVSRSFPTQPSCLRIVALICLRPGLRCFVNPSIHIHPYHLSAWRFSLRIKVSLGKPSSSLKVVKSSIVTKIKCLCLVRAMDDTGGTECAEPGEEVSLYIREYENSRIKYALSNAPAFLNIQNWTE